MEKEKIEALLKARALADQELERMRAPVTILFSDIKGSTAYFEQRGDLEGLAMVRRLNDLLIPVIEKAGGRVVKTIGDAIMASFENPVNAVKAGIGMQHALESDRAGRSPHEQIHIRIGMHTGLGLIDESDIHGDVVNAASRVQHQAEPDQILITDVLLDAAKAAGVQCAKLGRAELRGKDEPIDIYAVAWSVSASMQLIEDLQADFDRKLKDAKRQQVYLEEEFEAARDQWRGDRRRLTSEIENLEEKLEVAAEGSREEFSEELQSELRFQLEEAIRAKQHVEEELVALQSRWDQDRNTLKGQIASIQAAALEAMERSNNPTRFALAVRERVDARLNDARQDWNLQWEGERRRLNAEIERLRKATNATGRKEAARRSLLEKLGKIPASHSSGPKTADQWEEEFAAAKIAWESERDKLKIKIHQFERETQYAKNEIRSEILEELRGQFESRLGEANRERKRLEDELKNANSQVSQERQRIKKRTEETERAIVEAQDAVRKQVTAELQADLDETMTELSRMKLRNERRFQDASEEWEAERRRLRRQITALEEQLKEAKDEAFRSQRNGARPQPAERTAE
jgi:class 3 adenylate cyclase